MRGSYWFKAKSKKVLFEFSIRRNITVIKGDSATGKTTVLHILYEYLRMGRQSGYSVSTNAEYYPMRRKTPCFSYGDIRRVHRVYASN